MTYRFGDYNLYTRDVQLQSGRQQTIYFFAKNEPKSGTPCSLPRGYAVKVSDRTGMPLLYKDPNANTAPAPSSGPTTDRFSWMKKIFGH